MSPGRLSAFLSRLRRLYGLVLRLDELALRRLDGLVLRLDRFGFRACRVSGFLLGIAGDGHESSYVIAGLKGLKAPWGPFFLWRIDGVPRCDGLLSGFCLRLCETKVAIPQKQYRQVAFSVPGSPAIGLHRWGGSKSHLEHSHQRHFNSGFALAPPALPRSGVVPGPWSTPWRSCPLGQ